MTTLDTFLDRSQQLAADRSAAGTFAPDLGDALPGVKAVIIACADMRSDPAHVLGIKPNEAVVLRNIGGRVQPSLLEQMGLLGRIGEVAGEAPGGGGEFHLIVLHHTDCGMTRLAGDTDKLAHYFQIDESKVGEKAVSDPHASVKVDVAVLRSIPVLPAAWLLSGLVYDVATGEVEVVEPPAAIRAEG